MDYGLWTSIIDQAIELHVPSISPFRLGDPVEFPSIFKFLEYLDGKNISITMFSNGNGLTQSRADRFIELSNVIGEFVFSFHGHDKESMKRNMGLDFDKVSKNIKYFMSKNPQMRTEIYMLTTDFNNEASMTFKELWDGYGFTDVWVKPFMEWGGNKHTEDTLFDAMVKKTHGDLLEQMPCCRLLQQMDIQLDGKVVLCCLDAHGDILMGDLTKQTIEEVWDHPLRQYYMSKHNHNQFDLPLCRQCSVNIRTKASN